MYIGRKVLWKCIQASMPRHICMCRARTHISLTSLAEWSNPFHLIQLYHHSFTSIRRCVICLIICVPRSKTVGDLAQTSCCPMASSHTMWRTANKLLKYHAAWRVKTSLNYHKTIFIKISFLEKLKRFIQRPLFLTSSLRVDLALARTDKWQDSKIVLLNFKSTMNMMQ